MAPKRFSRTRPKNEAILNSGPATLWVIRMPTALIEITSTMPKPMMPHSTQRSLAANCPCSSPATVGSAMPDSSMTFEMSRVAWYIL